MNSYSKIVHQLREASLLNVSLIKSIKNHVFEMGLI